MFAGVQTEIVGPSPNWGRVEVLYKGVRATVCNKYVDDEEATLVCRQHGYKGGNITGHGNLAVEEQTPILLTSPSCVGNETSLNQCNSFNSSTLPFRVTCSHVSDFYVLCHNQSEYGPGHPYSDCPLHWFTPVNCGVMMAIMLSRIENTFISPVCRPMLYSCVLIRYSVASEWIEQH